MKIVKALLIIGSLSYSLLAIAGTLVNGNNYVEAEMDLTFASVYAQVGDNTFRHDRTLMPLDKQPAVTMNRDTIYSLGVFYAPPGTTITLPKTKDNRYQSAMMLQADHYIDQVFYGPGTFEIKSQTDFVGITIRTQLDANDPEDIKYVNSIQDQIVVTHPEGVEIKSYTPRKWDMKSLKTLKLKYQKEAAKLPNFNETSGAHGTIDPHLQRLGVSVALGLLPPEHAMYVYRDFGLKKDICYKATYTKPEIREKGFFSFTMYGADKYIKSERSNLNDRTIKYNADGRFTIHYGSKEVCGDADNRLETPEDNWYLGMRIYRASKSVLENGYDMPVPKPIK